MWGDRRDGRLELGDGCHCGARPSAKLNSHLILPGRDPLLQVKKVGQRITGSGRMWICICVCGSRVHLRKATGSDREGEAGHSVCVLVGVCTRVDVHTPVWSVSLYWSLGS